MAIDSLPSQNDKTLNDNDLNHLAVKEEASLSVTSDPKEYSLNELMIVTASKALTDGEVVFVGIGLPNVACNFALRSHAQSMTLIYESGAVGARPKRLPMSIGDPSLVTQSLSICSMADVFQYYLQGNRVDVGFLGGAQVDRYGNINSTVIGDSYEHPKVRLPGAGGASSIALHAKRLMIITPQTPRAFPEKVDFITSPGFLTGGNARQSLGVKGGGPQVVITDKGVYQPHPETCELMLVSIHPGVTLDEINQSLGWEVVVSSQCSTTPLPEPELLTILREDLAFS
ncbi:MAG: CoA-transferase subunit beta [Cyanobacteria bacterium]|nr:CoA-transferase subunit beta [Cyanobacteriota bacterium]